MATTYYYGQGIRLALRVLLLQQVFISLGGGTFSVDSFPLLSTHGVATHRVAKSLHMAPKYDPTTGRWEPMDSEEDSSAGYSALGSLIRQGPVPFFQRIKDPDMYDQAVLKMMATSEQTMSRDEAQGNMDAYLQNPNDWALQKMEEKNGAPVFDYANANMDSEDLILTAAWAGLLLTLVGRIAYVSAFGCDDFCRQYHW
jgi:hypothetical protein